MKFGKEEWIALFHEINLSEKDMLKWHQSFERKHPENHQSFLEWLGLDEKEIFQLRKASKS